MLTPALFMLAVGMNVPENPSFDYSGVPSLPGATLKTHGVQVDMSTMKVATVTSTSVYKNETNKPVTLTLTIPRRRIGDAQSGNPTFNITALWNNAPIKMAPATEGLNGVKIGTDDKSYSYHSDLVATVSFKAGQTCSLKINYSLPFGRCGYEQKQRIAAYKFDESNPIGLLSISYRYGGPTVFRLPEAQPTDWGWQIGTKGVFARKENFESPGELTYISFYPGGFEPIGGPNKDDN
ncbi:MAG: hypothetical protein BGO01_20240 [Armatimonadetes bacterium 55-13]|nr:hypothetical protein [Armatimonadota bacterium]OJU64442.1 MAG: hypothetical protein BGO01_20240 [Armatimonadetes bacterium 55-13]